MTMVPWDVQRYKLLPVFAWLKKTIMVLTFLGPVQKAARQPVEYCEINMTRRLSLEGEFHVEHFSALDCLMAFS